MNNEPLVPPVIVVSVAVFGIVFVVLMAIASLIMGPDTPEQIEQRQTRISFEQSSHEEVSNCLSMSTPWRCLQKMSVSDGASPPPAGVTDTRVSYLMKLVSLKDVLQFCTASNEVNCAEKLVGYGYSNQDVLQALRAEKS